MLAFAQRRMGPTVLGRNGAFQIFADLFKMLSKEIFLIPRPTTVAAPIFLSLLFSKQGTDTHTHTLHRQTHKGEYRVRFPD